MHLNKLLISSLIFISCSSNVLKTNQKSVSIYSNGELITDKWNLSKKHNPDIYFQNIKKEQATVSFKSDVGYKKFVVKDGSVHDLTILFKNEKYNQRIIGEKLRPKASFSKEYVNKNKGKIQVSIPKAYELVNIAIALSDFGKTKKGIVVKDTEYYNKVVSWFGKHSDHQFVKEIGVLCGADLWAYFNVKMSGYSFYFEGTKLKRSNIFGSTSFQNNNILKPYISLMESFANKSNFHSFYKVNKSFYRSLENYYETKSDVKKMKNWLERNYPGNGQYDYTNIIFSPLVGSNQSLVSFSNNGFKELQPHVNFPFKHFYKDLEGKVSEKGLDLYRDTILFTEVNHGYADLESMKYKDRIIKATSNRKKWAREKMLETYPSFRLFNEYMNWGLVALRISDTVKGEEARILIERVKHKMTEGRKFYKFNEFSEYLLKLYKRKKQSQTLADLYPKIIDWFARNN